MAKKHEAGDHPPPGGTHMTSSPDVTEGGEAPKPTEGGHGHPKGAFSTASDAGSGTDDTSHATAGKKEKEHAAEIGGAKAHGRGHHKPE